MDVQRVAHHIIRALKKRKRIIIIDWRYRLLVFFWKLIPSFIWKYLPVRN